MCEKENFKNKRRMSFPNEREIITSGLSFTEWVEFSPYEIGMPKYGTFMDSELFGSKFFMGKLVRKFDEQPLHFLQGECISYLLLACLSSSTNPAFHKDIHFVWSNISLVSLAVHLPPVTSRRKYIQEQQLI